jgi:beta-glucosidase
VLTGAAAASIAITMNGVQAATPRKQFPKSFRWGVSTAGHQIEGNNVNSDLWLMENIKPTTFKERSGDACDSYHRYEEDIALLAKLGFNTYRFSIEWARIEPTRGYFSNAELDYYKRVIGACRNHGIDPAVTFMHVSVPRWFAEAGGWLNPEAPSLFANFCSKAAKALAADMAFAFTINEPQVAKTFRAIPNPQVAAYFANADAAELAAHTAAAKATNCERYVTMNYPDIDGMTPQLIAGHEQGFAAIKAERSTLPTGVTLNLIDFQPGSDDSPYREVRQAAYGPWLESCRRAGDFVGAQVYRQMRIPGKGQPYPPPPAMPFIKPDDMTANLSQPSALGNGVEYLYDEIKKPIFVTENGLETEDDKRRIWYVDQVLSGLHASIAKGVPVIGYFTGHCLITLNGCKATSRSSALLPWTAVHLSAPSNQAACTWVLSRRRIPFSVR